MSSYGQGDHAKAANLHIHLDYTFGELTAVDGLPNSKATFSRWAEQGKGTGGTPWAELKETIETEAMAVRERDEIEQRIESLDQVAEKAGPLLMEVTNLLREQLLSEGDANPTVTKYAKLIEKMRSFAEQQHVADIHDRLEGLASEIGQIIGQQVQDDTATRRIRAEVQKAFNRCYRDIDDLLGIGS